RTAADASFLDKVKKEQEALINYLREKYLQQKVRRQTIYTTNEGDYDPGRIEELEKLLFLNDDRATPYEIPGVNTYSRTDLCIVLDQSGSTSGYANDMATMAGVFLSAFEELEEMRTCLISLKGDVTVCKFFDEPVEATSLYPTAEGGTPIATALELALKQNWQSELKFLILVSDGIFPLSELSPVDELKRNGINLVAVSSSEHIPLFDLFIRLDDKKELAEKISSFVLPEMIDGFYQEL
ncbi:MAG: VWA domain-containing protein, partial [Thermoplasmatales archaeon]